nr:probable amino acid permease 7 isoform X2 [Ipomoea batatas]
MQMETQQPSAPKGDPILSGGHDVIRTGTVLSAVAHIIAAVIGAGVLSLAWSTAQLGWIAGPGALLCFAVVTYISVSLLSQCYMSPTGHRNPTYMDAVRFNLGSKHRWMCGLLQYVSMYGTCIAYVITTSTSMRAIEKSNCYHKNGHEANCGSTGIGTNVFMMIFGIAQIFASQIPDFHNMAWLSIVAALMSFGYASIGLGLGFATVIENREIKGSITGISTHTAAQKIWLSFQALADISFAYPYTLIVLEIQDTLKSPPPEHQTMNKASLAAILITTFFYTCCGCFGYAAFGNDTPGNLLTGFGFYDPYWLVDLANACIILHLMRLSDILSTDLCICGEMVLRKVPTEPSVDETPCSKTSLLASFPAEPFPAMFPNCICCINHRHCNAVPLLQPGFRSVGSRDLLAIGHLFPSRNVCCAEENWSLDKKVGFS